MKKVLILIVILILTIFLYNRSQDKRKMREDFVERTKWLKKDMEVNEILNVMQRSPDNIYDGNINGIKEKNRYKFTYYCDFYILDIYLNDSIKLDHIDLFAD